MVISETPLHIKILNLYLFQRVYSQYFRINNDLLLWEPTAPSPVETVESMPYGVGLSVASQLINTYSKDSFSQFRSTGPEGEMTKITSYDFAQSGTSNYSRNV